MFWVGKIFYCIQPLLLETILFNNIWSWNMEFSQFWVLQALVETILQKNLNIPNTLELKQWTKIWPNSRLWTAELDENNCGHGKLLLIEALGPKQQQLSLGTQFPYQTTADDFQWLILTQNAHKILDKFDSKWQLSLMN